MEEVPCFRQTDQPPEYERYITVLSIDGGGVKGILPAVVLEYLESQLQELDGDQARLADYFDVIAGTSTGGLVTAMITSPDANNRPLYAANQIKPFYLENCPKIFPREHTIFPFGKMLKSLLGPLYDGKYLHGILKSQLSNTRLSQAITNVVIPAFDIKRLQPVIFSSYQAKTNKLLDAKFSDICISTSAAPTIFPGHGFVTRDENGNFREFDLIDGGVAANNPALIAITEVTKQMFDSNMNFFHTKPVDYPRLLVISVGTGAARIDEKYNAKLAAKWGMLDWLLYGGTMPLLEVFTQASADMVDFHSSLIFQALYSEENYLRIQDDTLCGTESTVDVATTENLNRLVEIGERLLRSPVSRVNLESGLTEPVKDGGTNEDAIKRFANLLSTERKCRVAKNTAGSRTATVKMAVSTWRPKMATMLNNYCHRPSETAINPLIRLSLSASVAVTAKAFFW
ncbi:patatin-like protein 2 [Andrographis paniculata]|uniref:patatin-like protein 2 n=1 Tax=Andrographis paniculata TaxID=175694 RepID=UPI0021E71D16|nr:patatin-like protein 2 [Andrographis paniculata]